jgi:hypothetical protein
MSRITRSSGDGVSLSSIFLEFCAKVRKDDPSILPELGKPFKIRDLSLSEREHMELADALLENNSVTYLELMKSDNYTKSSAEAMAKYVRTSKRLQRIRWPRNLIVDRKERTTRTRKRLQRIRRPRISIEDHRELVLQHQREEMLCCFLSAFQESTSLKELDMELPRGRGPSNLAFENMLTNTQSLRSLTLICPAGLLVEDMTVAAARSGLKKNTTLRELTLDISQDATSVSSILTSLRDHPLLRRLCLRGPGVDLNGLRTVLLSDKSKITELEIQIFREGRVHTMGLTYVLQALARRTALTKLGLHGLPIGYDGCPLSRDEARLLRMALCNISSLQSLALKDSILGNTGLAELAPALYCNTSIRVLDLSQNNLNDMGSAELLRDILRSNKTMTALDLSGNEFGRTASAVEYVADGLGSNSTLLKIDLSMCALGDGGVSTLARNLGPRNTTLQKLTLVCNAITSKGVGVLLDTMEQNSHHITDLELQHNPIGDEGASLLARSLGKNALPSLTRLSLTECSIGDDGVTALMSALKQNTVLLHLDLRDNRNVSERAFLALAESLPDIKVLQRVDFSWCTGLTSAMPLLLAGLRKNTSLFRLHVPGCAPPSAPPTHGDTARCDGGWMQEIERLGYRNRFRPLIGAWKERLPPRGLWQHALARVAALPDVIFEVLGSKPNLVRSEDTQNKEAAEDTGIAKERKRGDE